MSTDEGAALFLRLVAMQLRHWPAGELWVYLMHPGLGLMRVYRDGSYEPSSHRFLSR